MAAAEAVAGATAGRVVPSAVASCVLPGFPLHVVDEKYSTEEARELYWELFPPKGWRRLIPLGLQTPPEPLDGYAAVVQARRFLQQEQEGSHE